MEKQTMPDYETIRAAVAGEKWAVKEVIDEDMRQYITMKLIEALPQFPLDELEKQNRE